MSRRVNYIYPTYLQDMNTLTRRESFMASSLSLGFGLLLTAWQDLRTGLNWGVERLLDACQELEFSLHERWNTLFGG